MFDARPATQAQKLPTRPTEIQRAALSGRRTNAEIGDRLGRVD